MIFLHAAVDRAATLPEIAVGGGLRATVPHMSLTDALFLQGYMQKLASLWPL